MIRQIAFPLGLVVVLLTLVVGWSAVMRPSYFPPVLFAQKVICDGNWSGRERSQTIMSEFEADWYSGSWRAAGELPLFESRRPTVRFTWLRSFHGDVIVRLDGVGGRKVVMTATKLGDPSGDARVVRDLSPSEVQALDRVLASASLRAQPVRDCERGLDGSTWIIEVTGREGYIYRNRWSPTEGPVHDVGMHLIGLTGWNFDTIY